MNWARGSPRNQRCDFQERESQSCRPPGNRIHVRKHSTGDAHVAALARGVADGRVPFDQFLQASEDKCSQETHGGLHGCEILSLGCLSPMGKRRRISLIYTRYGRSTKEPWVRHRNGQLAAVSSARRASADSAFTFSTSPVSYPPRACRCRFERHRCLLREQVGMSACFSRIAYLFSRHSVSWFGPK